MLEIRYRLCAPRSRLPWSRGLDESPTLALHSDRVEAIDGGFATESRTRARSPHAARIAAALGATPADGAVEWRASATRSGRVRLSWAWKEPWLDDAASPFRVAADVLGPRAESSFRLDADGILVRHVVPTTAWAEDFWPRLTAALTNGPGDGPAWRIELERFAPAPGACRLRDWQAVLAAAFRLGYYDEPPRASLDDVSLVTGVPARDVRAHLTHLERSLRS